MGLAFGKAQIAAGADMVSIGDAAASLVGPELYAELVWPFEKKLVDGLHAMGTRVRLHICGNTSGSLAKIGELGCDIVDLDYPVSIAQARAEMGPDQVLLGNIEPAGALRNQRPEDVTKAIAECHRQAGPRYIVSAGCEVCRDTPAENVMAMRNYARSHR
jgi:uroporphyrinogen-III decarboxylase